MIKFLKAYVDSYFAAGYFGTLMFIGLFLHASRTNFGAINNKVEVPTRVTFAEAEQKLSEAHVPYIFSFKTISYLAKGK